MRAAAAAAAAGPPFVNSGTAVRFSRSQVQTKRTAVVVAAALRVQFNAAIVVAGTGVSRKAGSAAAAVPEADAGTLLATAQGFVAIRTVASHER